MGPLELFAGLLAFALAGGLIHNVGHTWQRGNDGSTLINLLTPYDFEGEINLDPVVGNAVTDLNVIFSLDVSAAKIMVLQADQNLTIKTNSSSTPDETLNLVANKPYVWTHDGYAANFFETDLTGFFVTNATATTTTLKIRILYDPTP